MNDRLPYEEQLAQQWNDLSLPDENMAWEDMKRRLEEDDDGGIIPIWLRGCGLWGLLVVVVLGIGWWLIRPDKWGNKKQQTESVTTINQKEDTGSNKIRIAAGDSIQEIKSKGKEKPTDGMKDISKNSSVDSSLTSLPAGQNKTQLKKKDTISIQVTGASSKRKEPGSKQQTVKKNNKKNKNPDNKQKQTESELVDISITPGIKNKKTSDEPVETKDKPVVTGKDSMSVTTVNTNKPDSLRNIFPDTAQKKKPEQVTKTNEPKKDSSKSKAVSFSAGLGMHQLLPIAGQKLTPYNSAGRKGSLADYIPSVFARMYKNDKWFLQAEFRYGAPQYTKEFLYKQTNKLDTVGAANHIIKTSSKLKKTFYHQLPLSFNYFILPNWSIGTGIVWNKFVSAVSQQEVRRQDITTLVDSLVSDGLITDKNDTLFKKSYFQGLFETQYKWRRFSIGARYSFGLQPYIKFTLPGGLQQQEKNKSLQVFLRYELWKSKAKR